MSQMRHWYLKITISFQTNKILQMSVVCGCGKCGGCLAFLSRPILSFQCRHCDPQKDAVDGKNADASRHGDHIQRRTGRALFAQDFGWGDRGEGERSAHDPEPVQHHPAPLSKCDCVISVHHLQDKFRLDSAHINVRKIKTHIRKRLVLGSEFRRGHKGSHF